MNFVENFDFFGVAAKEIPCIKGTGAPTTATEGAVGCFYMNTTTGDLYKCTAVTNSGFTWKEVNGGSGGSSDGAEISRITKNLELRASDNLCNPDAVTLGAITDAGVASSSTSYMYTEKIEVVAGDVLTFYYNASDTIATAQARYVTAYDSEDNVLGTLGGAKVYSYTVPAGVSKVVVSFAATYVTHNGGFVLLKNYEGTPTSAIYYSNCYVATEDFLEDAVGMKALTDEVKAEIRGEPYTKSDYISNEVKRVNRETLNSDGILNFIFSTDQHLASDLSDLYIMKEVASVANSGRFDFLCMGGDMIQSGDTSWYRATDANGNVTKDNGFQDKKEIVIDHMTQIANTFKDVKIPVYFCQGNHDVCFGAYHGARDYNAYYGYSKGNANYKDPNAQSLLPREFFRLMNNRLGETVVWDGENPNGGYFYKDFDRAKIRVIFLQTQDVFNDDGTVVDTVNNTSLNPRIQQKQFAWFCNKALNFMDKGEDRTNWAVVILSHVNVTLGGVSGGSISNEQCALIRGVLNAFMTGVTYTASTPSGFDFPLSASVDFTEQGAVDFICSINGHVHADTVMNIGEVIGTYTSYHEPSIDRPSIQVSATNGTLVEKDYSASQLKDYFIIPERVEGTISCECFDIFSIDRVNRKIKTIRFGAGDAREIDY